MAKLYTTGPCHLWVGVGDTTPSHILTGTLTRFEEQQRIMQDAEGRHFLQLETVGQVVAQVTTEIEVRSFNTPQYLGTCEEAPNIEIIPYYKSFPTDMAGGVDGPGEDDFYLGEEAMIEATLTRWSEAVYATISSKPRFGPGRGSIARRDIGTMMVRERRAYPIWVQMPYGVRDRGFAGASSVTAAAAAVFGGLGNVGQAAAAISNLNDIQPAGYRFFHCWLVAPEAISPGTKPKKISIVWKAKMGPETGADNDDAGRFLYDHDMKDLPRFQNDRIREDPAPILAAVAQAGLAAAGVPPFPGGGSPRAPGAERSPLVNFPQPVGALPFFFAPI